ncbi:lipopolysaccharide biosynthesis protein [Streptococcus sp. CSL10205-OR2]|uniref:lipopolysaccharide biosynthesis protein n=1 Tax=Streptococcus sp. CSL10205-OR2 TaxID=2980558 RepID=UPI0021DB6D3C|nr:lipopolysaccharide biosynthesis protein [Streptococcus sp. CSL10205-OR2]MCU9533737.1 lipopolysaccharide biosynthesis protein [Streptococcus sp. CSL10205-OR2]
MMISSSKNVASNKMKFIWNMLGTTSTAAVSILLLMIVSRFLTKIEADIFSFAYAVGNQLITIALFQVRNLQSTDINQKYKFKDYLYTRIITCIAMLAISGGYIYFTDYDIYKDVIIWIICLYRCLDALSDVFQGFFQQKERLDFAGKSLFYRNSFVLITFTLTLIFSKNLILSLILICLVSIFSLFLFDVKPLHYFKIDSSLKSNKNIKILKLLQDSFPLFINGFLLIFIYNQSKFSLDKLLELGKLEPGIQTQFNILFMPIFVINLIFLFLRSYITTMAVHFVKKEIAQFNRIEKTLFKYLTGISIIVLFLSYLIGIPVLSAVYRVDLSQYKTVFIMLIFGGILSTFATMIDNFLTVMRYQKFLIIPYFLAFIVSFFTSDWLAGKYDVWGVTISFNIAMAVWLILSLIIYKILKHRMETENVV